MTQKFTLNVNGKTHTVDADPDMPLLYALRDDIGLNNPHFGCGLAQCGACTVHLDGQPVRSCITPVSMAAGAKVVTLANDLEDSLVKLLIQVVPEGVREQVDPSVLNGPVSRRVSV